MLDPTERGILGQQNVVVSAGTWPGCYGDTCAFRFLIVRGIGMLFHLISLRNHVSVILSSSRQPLSHLRSHLSPVATSSHI